MRRIPLAIVAAFVAAYTCACDATALDSDLAPAGQNHCPLPKSNLLSPNPAGVDDSTGERGTRVMASPADLAAAQQQRSENQRRLESAMTLIKRSGVFAQLTLRTDRAAPDPEGGAYQVGYVENVDAKMKVTPDKWQANPGLGRAYAATIRVSGATALRAEVSTSAPVDAYIVGSNGSISGPFHLLPDPTWVGVGSGDEYSIVLSDGRTNFQRDQSLDIEIRRIEVLDERFAVSQSLVASSGTGAKTYCNDPAILPCIVNASCYGTSDFPAIESARAATALVQYNNGTLVKLCTGTLLDDIDPSTNVPYFLTANHCISTQATAATTVYYWDYRTSCSSNNCDSSTIRTQYAGSDLLSTGAAPSLPDYTLLRIRSPVPIGIYGRAYMPVHSGTVGEVFLFRISHPHGEPQAFTRSILRGSSWIGSGVCSAAPYPGFIYSTLNIGATQPGSSGSALMLPSGAIVGQLMGTCGRGETCAQDWDVDGQMYFTYPRIQSWLNQFDLLMRTSFE